MSTNDIVAATRLHLGRAASPPSSDDLQAKVSSFRTFCEHAGAKTGLIAVDSTPKIDGYCLVDAVREACAASSSSSSSNITVLPVTPWGKFVPALNALLSFAAVNHAKYIIFVSAETSATAESMQHLLSHMMASSSNEETLVAGALLPGHDYTPGRSVALNGRTTPWNTLAVWNVEKLARTGFQMVSEGVLTDDRTSPSYGVEEAVAIALLQKLLGKEKAVAKVVKLPGVNWEQDFEDEERKKWHEEKMKSKETRAARQLQLLGLSGEVQHV